MQRFSDNRHKKSRIILSFNELQHSHIFSNEKDVEQFAVTRKNAAILQLDIGWWALSEGDDDHEASPFQVRCKSVVSPLIL